MNIELYKEMADLNDKHWWFVGRRKIIKAFFKSILNKKLESILDVGSGVGGNFSVLKHFTENIYGIDSSKEAIKYSKKNYPEIEISQRDLLDLNTNKKYGGVSLFDVLEHLDNEGESLKKIHSILGDKGKLFITVPAYMFMWTKHDDRAHHKRRYTKSRLAYVLKQNGFGVDRISYFNFFLFLPILFIRFLKIGEDSSDFSKTPGILNSLFKIIFRSEAFFIRYFNFPWGVSIVCLASKNEN